MTQYEDARIRQKSLVVVCLILFALILFLLQLWLFVTTLESAIAGHVEHLAAAAAGSFALVVVDWWMLKGIERMERAP